MCGINCLSISETMTRKPLFITAHDMVYNSFVGQRGNDSYGFSFVTDGKIKTFTDLGAPDMTTILSKAKYVDTQTIIGHVRNATHGSVTYRNAHPIPNETGEFVLIHNGVIYCKQEYQLRRTHNFIGQTDSEIMVHLFEEKWNGKTDPDSLLFAISKVFSEITGYANLILLFEDNTILAVCDGTLSSQTGKNFVRLSSIPTDTGHWEKLKTGDALVIRNGEILATSTVETHKTRNAFGKLVKVLAK